jgi:hypothetical protein
MNRIDVIVSTRDRPVALVNLLHSLINQTYQDSDCVVVDGSVGDQRNVLMVLAFSRAGATGAPTPGSCFRGREASCASLFRIAQAHPRVLVTPLALGSRGTSTGATTTRLSPRGSIAPLPQPLRS